MWTCNMKLQCCVFLLLLLVNGIWMKSSGTIRVGYIINPPYTIVTRIGDNQIRLKGPTIDLLEWISADLNISYHLVEIDFSNGFDGVVKQVAIKNLDLAIGNYGIILGRNNLMTPLFPYVWVSDSLVIPYPKPGNDPWSILKPFQPKVWALIVLCTLIVAAVLKLVSAVKRYMTVAFTNKQPANNTKALQMIAMYVLGVMTNQGGYLTAKVQPLRLVAGLWCIVALVLVNGYSGSLITHLTTTKTTPIISSPEDLSKRTDIQLLAVNRMLTQISIQETKGALHPLASNLARMPPDTCGSIGLDQTSAKLRSCLERVKNGDHVLAVELRSPLRIIMSDMYKSTGECGLTVIPFHSFLAYSGSYIPLNKTHDFRNALDVSILRAFNYGLPSKWSQSYDVPDDASSSCLNFGSQPRTLRRLSLTDFRSAFVLLGLGYVLSCFVFLNELGLKHIAKEKPGN